MRFRLTGVLSMCMGVAMAQAPSSASTPTPAPATPATPQPKKEELSLADLARAARKGKPTPLAASGKVMVTNDNLQPRAKLLFDDIDLERDNSDALIAAMLSYKRLHTPAETENAIREWYQLQDSYMQNLVNQRDALQATAQGNGRSSYPRNSAAYREYEAQAMRQMQNQQDAYEQSRKVGILLGRLQQGLIKVRGGIQRENLRYDWFKILNGNGYGSF